MRQPKGSRRWSARIPALAAGKSAEITVPLPSGGQVGLPLVVVLDPSGEVVESDEKNNRVDVP